MLWHRIVSLFVIITWNPIFAKHRAICHKLISSLSARSTYDSDLKPAQIPAKADFVNKISDDLTFLRVNRTQEKPRDLRETYRKFYYVFILFFSIYCFVAATYANKDVYIRPSQVDRSFGVIVRLSWDIL